jgi:hypothetical protein
MKRVQVYLDDDLLSMLRLRARAEKSAISALVRRAIREQYLGKLEKHAAVMEAVVGMRKDRTDIGDSQSTSAVFIRANASNGFWNNGVHSGPDELIAVFTLISYGNRKHFPMKELSFF